MIFQINKSHIATIRCRYLLIAFLSLIFLPNGAGASDFQSPRTAALGGAGKASPLLNDSIHLNPSYASLLPTYSISLNYLNPSPGVIYNVSLQDGRTELFQAGVSFTKRPDGKLISIGASKSFVRRFGFGIGGKFFYDTPSGEIIREMNLSGTLIATRWLQVAFMFDNLIQSQIAKEHGFYREFALGTKVNIEGTLLLYFDPHLIPDLPGNSIYGHEMGVELAPMKDFFIRGGRYFRSKNPTHRVYGHGWGAGVGWIGPRLSIDYALTRSTEPLRENTHVFGMTMYF